MQITNQLHDDEMILELTGDIDGIGADELAVELSRAEESQAQRVILDFSGVVMITSSGLGTIIMTFKRLKNSGRFLELKNLQPNIRKVFLMTGLDKMLKLQAPADEILNIGNLTCQRAMQNAKDFFSELLGNLGIKANAVAKILEDVFHIYDKPIPPESKVEPLRELLADLNLPARMADSQKNLASDMHERIRPYMVGMTSLLHVRSGEGKLSKLFKRECDKIQLIDVEDRNQTELPFMKYDGVKIPLPDKSFDSTLLNCVLNHCQNPNVAMAEIIRVTRKRIIVIESICLNETQRQFNMFFDWLFNVVLGQSQQPAYNFKKPGDWKWFFRDAGVSIRASVDMGLDHPTVPEYHWMYVLEIPGL